MSEAPPDNRIPRGALIVVAVGLVACVVAALLATNGPAGDAAHLEWVQEGPIADSKPAAIPGGGEMRLTEGGMKATGTNVSGSTPARRSAAAASSAG
jgi:hypothetical protein